MKLTLPERFLLGTSTASAQIEKAFDHNWKGWKAIDGSTLDDTTKHDERRAEDAEIIASLGDSYRFSMDWSRLQRAPYAPLETKVVDEYREFMGLLKDKGVNLMLVIHHFSNPSWFAQKGAFESAESPSVMRDYAAKVRDAFGDLVDYWNTINEPSTILLMGYYQGYHPPGKRNLRAIPGVLRNMSRYHKLAYSDIKEKYPDAMVGVSNATMVLYGASPAGKIVSAVADFVYNLYVPDQFNDSDFTGISYYGKVPFKPLPIEEVYHPGELKKMGKEHDKMWEYYPAGLKEVVARLYHRYKKPVIITENGACTDDEEYRKRSIKEHLASAMAAIEEGIDLRGYFHWTAWDNFEWNCGWAFPFGLYEMDKKTFERRPKESGLLYSEIKRTRTFDS